MSVLKYKDPVTGEWKAAASVKLVEKVGKDEVYPFADVPDYVKEEAEAVARAVRGVQTGKTLTFAAMADTHIGMALTSNNAVKTRASAEMAGQGLAYLRNILPVHAAFVLGDLTWSDGAYAVQQVKDDWNGTVKRLSVGFGGIPSAWTAGNHEINYGIGRERSMTEDEIYGYIGAESSGLTRDSDYPQKCYGYMDFPIQKIRVIVLNTADTLTEYPESNTAVKAKSEWVGAVQLQWLADTALDFSDKDDATEWGIVICSHHPIAYGGQSGIGRSLQILEAYRDGAKGSITYTSDKPHTVSYDFTSGEKAEIICNIHGHSHNFVYKKRSSTSSSSGNVEPWLWSFCIPCINCGRENEQATNEALKDNYGDFDASGKPVYYYKTSGTRNGTSFCVITIDPDDKMVYAHKFGAGVNRSVYYGAGEDIVVPINTVLTGCNIDNSAKIVPYGSSYRAVITPYEGYVIGSLSVSMSGKDITSTAVSGSTIYIASVTGQVEILAMGGPDVAPYTNWLKADKAGYTNGKRLSSNGAESEAGGYTLSGYIPCKVGDVIRFAGITGLNASDSDATNHRVSFYDASKAHVRQLNVSSTGLGSATSASSPYYKPVYDSDGDIIEFTIPSADNNTTADLSSVAYMRFCTANGGITADSVVTVNEVIE